MQCMEFVCSDSLQTGKQTDHSEKILSDWFSLSEYSFTYFQPLYTRQMLFTLFLFICFSLSLIFCHSKGSKGFFLLLILVSLLLTVCVCACTLAFLLQSFFAVIFAAVGDILSVKSKQAPYDFKSRCHFTHPGIDCPADDPSQLVGSTHADPHGT